MNISNLMLKGAVQAILVMFLTLTTQIHLWILRHMNCISRRKNVLVFLSALTTGIIGAISVYRFVVMNFLPIQTLWEIALVCILIPIRNFIQFTRTSIIIHENFLQQFQSQQLNDFKEKEYFNVVHMFILKMFGFKTKQIDLFGKKMNLVNFSSIQILKCFFLTNGVLIILSVGYMSLAMELCQWNKLLCANQARYFWILGVVLQFLFLILIPWFVLKLNKMSYPYLVKQELIFLFTVDFLTSLSATIVYYTLKTYDGMLIIFVGSVLHLAILYLFPMINLLSVHKQLRRKKHSLDDFKRVFQDKQQWVLFKKQLEQDFCYEHGVFMDKFEELSLTRNEVTLKKLTKDLYNNFIKLGSKFELNLSAKMRQDLMNYSAQDKLELRHFQLVRQEIWMQMYLNSYPRFLIKS